MVMGAVGGVGGVGVPGPPGPPGVQGPPGPIGTIDANSPLAVQTKAMALMGLPIPTNQWAVINFAPPEIDTHQAVVLGPLWRWTAPMRGVYHLQTTMRLDAALGSPTWELRVLRSNQLVAETSITGLSGQISWLGVMQPLVTLQVLIRSSTPLILASDPLNFPGSISIAGVGVAL
jgi:hypothetical protein